MDATETEGVALVPENMKMLKKVVTEVKTK